MKSALARRIALLESQRGNTVRHMHIIAATDQNDAQRQMSDLIAAGSVAIRDGFLCITGKPLVRH
jgi:hypothetical protein